jgi:hypothetical protein
MQEESKIYEDAPERKYRHLDTMQYRTCLVAYVPLVINLSGKVSTIDMPWQTILIGIHFYFVLM